MSTKRSLRPRPASQYASQQEWNLDEDDVLSMRRFNALEKFKDEKFNVDHGLVREMKGEDFTLSYVQEHGLTHPLVFREAKGLGMKLPLDDFTVQDVKRLVGPRRVVDVMDTRTQEASTMTLSQWTKYYTTKPRQKILNVISLEFSCTKLDPLVQPPSMVSQLDWVELMWPLELKDLQADPTNDLRRMMYPKVQKYCLMSVAGCYTDFHVDFGGTSVWYHVLKGEKLFLLIPPSTDTYDLFKTWHMSGEQESIFFAELVSKAQLVRLNPGDTFIMPSGWIHAVYTPTDSLVFGGNFLHSFNIAQQLRVAEMEGSTKVPSKFRYPFYGTMHWYVVERYHTQLAQLGGARERSTTPLPCPDQEVGEDGDASKTLSLINGKWLKGVSLKKVHVGSKKRSNESAPPFLSIYEREGLLMLIQQMLKRELFSLDAPPTFTEPEELLRGLMEQLECSKEGEGLCASRPTGVGVVSPLSGGHLRKHRSSTSPKKRRRKTEGDAFHEGAKMLKRETSLTTKRRTKRKRRKSLVVSLPTKYIVIAAGDDGDTQGESQSGNGGSDRASGVREYQDVSSVNDVRESPSSDTCARDYGGSGSVGGDTASKRLCREEFVDQFVAESVGSERDEGSSSEGVTVTRPLAPLLSPPFDLTMTTTSSSPNRSPSPLSPCASPSQPFTLVLELESPHPSLSSPRTVLLTQLNQPHRSHAQDHTHSLEGQDAPVSPSTATGEVERQDATTPLS